MKYSITGHTYGIGKSVFEKLQPNIIGFSRSNGFDISDPISRGKIIDLSKDTDVFINNAQDQFYQTLLFLELWEVWKNDSEKTIINIGSRIADVKVLPPDKHNLIKYQAEKLILKEMSYRVSAKCKVVYVSFGYVGTEKILKKYPHFTSKDYISVDTAAEIIISNFKNHKIS